jgi:hypothetical protein
MQSGVVGVMAERRVTLCATWGLWYESDKISHRNTALPQEKTAQTTISETVGLCGSAIRAALFALALDRVHKETSDEFDVRMSLSDSDAAHRFDLRESFWISRLAEPPRFRTVLL